MATVSGLEPVLDTQVSLPKSHAIGASLCIPSLRSIRVYWFTGISRILNTVILSVRDMRPQTTPTGLEPVTSAVTGRRDNQLRQGAIYIAGYCEHAACRRASFDFSSLRGYAAGTYLRKRIFCTILISCLRSCLQRRNLVLRCSHIRTP